MKQSLIMELALGLKITKLRDDNVISATEFRMAKDHSGPIFTSTEIDSMFVLSAHLKGYKREEIEIDINKDGTKLTIRGEKRVQEMLILHWRMYKQASNMRFIKAFRIPREVILDDVKAYFEEDSVLTITMPKSARGIRGNNVEELKEEDDKGMSDYAEGHSGMPKRELANHEDQIEEPVKKKESLEGNKKVDQAADFFPEEHKIEPGKQMKKMTEEGLKHSSRRKYSAMGIRGDAPVTETQETTETERLEPENPKGGHPKFEIGAKDNTIAEREGKKIESAKHEGPEESTKRLADQVIRTQGIATAIPSEEALNENKISQLETQQQKPEKMHTYSGEESKRIAEPEKGLKQMKTPSMNQPAGDHENTIKLCGGKERSETGNEVPGKKNGITVSQKIRADTQKSVQSDKPEGRSGEENRSEKHISTSSMFFSPCSFAGSAILVGFIMLVYQLIRSKKR